MLELRFSLQLASLTKSEAIQHYFWRNPSHLIAVTFFVSHA